MNFWFGSAKCLFTHCAVEPTLSFHEVLSYDTMLWILVAFKDTMSDCMVSSTFEDPDYILSDSDTVRVICEQT